MYSYSWDIETGGFILNSIHSAFSKEPRPVYYKELDILGFDNYWLYDKDDTFPYLWAETSNYYYRGKLVAKIKGGSIYTAPQIQIIESPEDPGVKLQPVDINKMVEKNKDILDSLLQDSIKRVYNTYIKYKGKVDVFYVAFSGGKDSMVVFDIVQRALPHNVMKVVFGDTGMEFCDTYKTVDKVREICENKNIDFIKAESHLDVKESWKVFGPPAQRLRWCCSVHKTTPQILALRKALNKRDFTGMAFIGIRADESLARSNYEYVSSGKKHKGQFNCNPILEWNSAEIYLYIYSRHLYINEAYKKGNSRAGCLVCPNSSGRSEYIKRVNYKEEFDEYIDIIKKTSNRQFETEKEELEFIDKSGWQIRNNGRDLKLNRTNYEEINKNTIKIIYRENEDWKEWIKTIGNFQFLDKNKCEIYFRNKVYTFSVKLIDEFQIFELLSMIETRDDIKLLSLFKSVLKKSSNCVYCKECEANCSYGCISMSNKLRITNCRHCLKCHEIDSGCLVYNSRKVLKGVERKMSIDSYASFGVEESWVKQYLREKEEFWTSKNNGLGSMKITALKRFLRDAKLKFEVNDDNCIANQMYSIYLKEDSFEIFWALVLANLAYARQINWFIKNTEVGVTYYPEEIIEKLSSFDNMQPKTKTNIVSSLKNIFNKTPIGYILNFGTCNMNKKMLVSIKRGSWYKPNSLVILYAMYRFAEECGDYYQFTLARLLNDKIESEGISPVRIFGLDRNEMEMILNGLTTNHHEFIDASFTLGLDKIVLNKNKTSLDVLKLITQES
ncbi:MAG: phosphoadenosine phosphosulfate reductase family protein [Erysipelotrichaceae bacterium]